MSTKNARYMVTVDKKLSHYLSRESENRHLSISKVILSLIEEAIDLREDYELSKIADEAWERNKDTAFISAREVWKECGLI